MRRNKIKDALTLLKALGLPKEQQNERSALSLLALLNMTPEKSWDAAEEPLIGITPMMIWMRKYYHKNYKPNTRETVRRQTMHQFVAAGIARYNPDDPDRPVNSPHAVYQISPSARATLRTFNSLQWDTQLQIFLNERTTLIDQYAKPREMKKIPVRIKTRTIVLSPGKHSQLIKRIVEEFGGVFVPDGQLVYMGDTGAKQSYSDADLFAKLGLTLDDHGKMPDVILYCPVRNWLILVEAVTSHGPVDGKRHQELELLFEKVCVGRVYVTAFASRAAMSRYLSNIAWETEVWIADAPTHLIHFNGSRFLGPYAQMRT